MLRAIKIIHSWNQIKEYRFLSDYFRMMQENIIEYECIWKTGLMRI